MEDLPLPEDMLAEVLRRLPARDLAAARCVRKSWRAAVDARRLMEEQDLLLQVVGIFLNFKDHAFSDHGHQRQAPRLPARHCSTVKDHCNGLLLLDEFVVNPATRRWAKLPPRSRRFFADDDRRSFREFDYIAFDPAMSPHYEVVAVPHAPFKWEELSDHTVLQWEWPPSPMTLQVCSSRTNAWEERSFLRQGDALGTIAELQPGDKQYAVYWRGQLYVHHHFTSKFQKTTHFGISLSSGKYQAIKPPPRTIHTSSSPDLRLGKSEKGVYLASIASPGQLQHQADLRHVLSHQIHNRQQVRGSWIMEDVNYHFYRSKFLDDDGEQALPENNLGWNSDNDDVLDMKDTTEERYNEYISILGFHPHKEVVFVGESLKRALAYHLNSSKLQDLGNIYPTCYDHFVDLHEFIQHSFPYTPC
ncbi:hypothetical protein BRADI_5g26861v3 [Brachypodium distachyon]|uniref:F-box domain-containing protein n=1 Tax=Brachypodium distachyon TaxID=15368 RepID=A0A0Q3GWQ8_BRADI|nr:hypothetical protein BRADI_5g26861v3 [Brachypodium distachyon]